MNRQKMIEWIGSHNVGISSKTMWCALMEVQCDRDDVPYDADDFSRCHDLYRFAWLTEDDLLKVSEAYPYWRPVIDRWDKLCRIYEGRCSGSIYDELHSLRDEIMRLKGFRKVGEGHWTKTRNLQ